MSYLANSEAHSRKSLEYKREDAETIGLYFAPRNGRWGVRPACEARLTQSLWDVSDFVRACALGMKRRYDFSLAGFIDFT